MRFAAGEDPEAMKPPPRTAWRDFPDVVLLADETRTARHPEYAAAKAGDAVAAARLVDALVDESGVAAVRRLIEAASLDRAPVLVSAHAYERDGFNAIPAAMARLSSDWLGLPYDTTVVQSNVVGHTGADGYGRLARQAAFAGRVEKQGGMVVGAVGLTGKPYSAKLSPAEEQLDELKRKHGPEFEKWWRENFGHAFDCLTQSEARYLARSPDVDTIRDRLAAAVCAGGIRSRA